MNSEKQYKYTILSMSRHNFFPYLINEYEFEFQIPHVYTTFYDGVIAQGCLTLPEAGLGPPRSVMSWANQLGPCPYNVMGVEELEYKTRRPTSG